MENMDMYMLNPCNNKIWWADYSLFVLASGKTILYDNCCVAVIVFWRWSWSLTEPVFSV